MVVYNPYIVDEIVSEYTGARDPFGLICDPYKDRTELYGYQVTLDGDIVIPSLCPSENEETEKELECIWL